MTRPQVLEGFRRVGILLGWAATSLCIVAVVAATEDRSGTWWLTTKWVAITAPAAYWCGSTVARICGWILAGFFRPEPDLLPNWLEAAKAAALESAGGGPALAFVVKIDEFTRPYLMFGVWVLGWLAADYAGDLVASWSPEPTDFPWFALCITRLVVGAVTFVSLFLSYTIVKFLFGELAIRLLEALIPSWRQNRSRRTMSPQ